MKHRAFFSNLGTRTIAFSLLASVTFTAAAQTVDESETDTQQASVTTQSASTQKVDTQETVKPTKAANSKSPSIKAQSAQSADNYEASEEVSEDLEVSFPVDI